MSDLPRWLVAAACVLGYVVLLMPLGLTLHYAARADERAEREGRTACSLAQSVGTLSETLDAGLALVLAEDEDEDAARAVLRTVVARADAIERENVAACNLARRQEQQP